MAFSVDVLTPSKVLAKNLSAESLLVPTEQGMINVLKDHTHLISKIDTGLVTCNTSSGPKHFICTTGICKIMGQKVVILTNVGEEAAHVNVQRAEAALEQARDRLKQTDNLSDEEILKFQRKLKRAELRIRTAKSFSK